jgi:hydroxylysine kinase
MYWDLAHLAQLEVFVPAVADEEKRALVRLFLDRYRTQVTPLLDTLPRSVCQNDANDHNIIVGGEPLRVQGVIDFGDIVHTLRIHELGICIAYALLDKEDLVGTAASIIQGYTEHQQLLPAERALLHTLAASRICQSVIMSSYSFSLNPGNTYLLVTAAPGWRALRALADMTASQIDQFNNISHG